MYSLLGYSHMIADNVRTSAHLKALEATVKPGMTVVDLGAGSGIFSLMACRLGASKVYAIETSNAVQAGHELTRVNGFENKIEWIQKDSKKVTLPDPADLLITDLRGCLPLVRDNLAVFADARDRLLKPDGVLLPYQDQLWISVADSPDTYQAIACPWGVNDFGFDLSPLVRRHSQLWKASRPDKKSLLTEPEKWATLDYKSISTSDVDEAIFTTVQQDATAHGFYLWFDAEIHPGIGFSGGPGPDSNSPSVYGSAFFPWSEPVEIKNGECISIHLEAKLVLDKYLWRWRTKIFSNTNNSEPRISFDQSTFHAESPSLAQLKKRGHSFTPQLSEDGQLHTRTLQLMDGKRTLETIADKLMGEFPDQLSTIEESLAYAGCISEKFSR